MIPSIQPRIYFPISRLLSDPADTGTYYVQAVVKNARTGVTVATLSLTDLGSRLFAYSWQSPADPSGQGLFLTITTHVFTDSGYTTPSDVYSDEHDTILIYDNQKLAQAISNQVNAQSTVGSVDEIDYKKIKKIVDESVKTQIDKVLAKYEGLKTGIEPLIAEIKSLCEKEFGDDKTEAGNMKAEMAKYLADITSAIAAVKASLPTDMQGDIVAKLQKAGSDVEYVKENMKPDLEPITTRLSQLQQNDGALYTLLKAISDALAKMPELRGDLLETRSMTKRLLDSTGETANPKPRLNQFGVLVKPRS